MVCTVWGSERIGLVDVWGPALLTIYALGTGLWGERLAEGMASVLGSRNRRRRQECELDGFGGTWYFHSPEQLGERDKVLVVERELRQVRGDVRAREQINSTLGH